MLKYYTMLWEPNVLFIDFLIEAIKSMADTHAVASPLCVRHLGKSRGLPIAFYYEMFIEHSGNLFT